MITNKQIKDLQPGTEYWVQCQIGDYLVAWLFMVIDVKNVDKPCRASALLMYKGETYNLFQPDIIDIKSIEEMG